MQKAGFSNRRHWSLGGTGTYILAAGRAFATGNVACQTYVSGGRRTWPDLNRLFLEILRVHRDVVLPLLGRLVEREDRFHGTCGHAGAAVDALVGVDVQLSTDANSGSSLRGWMQSTGHTSTHAVSFVPMHGSVMMYATFDNYITAHVYAGRRARRASAAQLVSHAPAVRRAGRSRLPRGAASRTAGGTVDASAAKVTAHGRQPRRHRVLQLHRLRAQRAAHVPAVAVRHVAAGAASALLDRAPLRGRASTSMPYALYVRVRPWQGARRSTSRPAASRRCSAPSRAAPTAPTTRSSAIRSPTSTSPRCGPTRCRPPPTTCWRCARAAGASSYPVGVADAGARACRWSAPIAGTRASRRTRHGTGSKRRSR